jgi:hypothetical protein
MYKTFLGVISQHKNMSKYALFESVFLIAVPGVQEATFPPKIPKFMVKEKSFAPAERCSILQFLSKKITKH